MKAFDHYSPKSLPEALEILGRLESGGMILAGGTDLQLKMRAGTVAPQAIVNIKDLPELKGIRFDKDAGAKIGALITLRELTRDAIIKAHYPALAQAAMSMASEQIRSFATMGGNLSNASPSADMAPPLMAMDAKVSIAGKSGERSIALEDFFQGPGSSVLQAGEVLTDISLPAPSGKTLFLKHSPRAFMDIAVVCLAIKVEMENDICRQIRIVLGAVAPVPMRAKKAEAALHGQALSDENIALAAKAAARECAPIDDVRGSGWYRREMVEVLSARGLQMLRDSRRGAHA